MKRISIIICLILVIFLFASFTGDNLHANPTAAPQKESGSLFASEKPKDFKIPDEVKGGISAIENNLVVIDAGHGGNDPGTRNGNLLEKEVNLDIAIRLNKLLRQGGVDTYMIRDKDQTKLSSKERVYEANAKKAALYISIHCNWFYDSSLSGMMALYDPSIASKKGNLTQTKYATLIQEELRKAFPDKSRGINDRTDLSVLKYAKMPSVLVELGFLSNAEDVKLLSSTLYRQRTAEALAAGIFKALDAIE